MSFQQGHQFPGSDFLCDCVATVCVTVNKSRSHPVCRVTALRMTLPIPFYFISGFFFLLIGLSVYGVISIHFVHFLHHHMYLAGLLETWMIKGRDCRNRQFNRPLSEQNLPEQQQESGCCMSPINLQDRRTGFLSKLTNPHTEREHPVPFMEPFSRTCLGVALPLLSLSSVPGFFFLLHVSVLELLSGGKKLFFSPPSFFPRILNCPEVCLTSFRAAITQLPVFLSIFYEIHLVTVLLRWPFILSNRKGTAM